MGTPPGDNGDTSPGDNGDTPPGTMGTPPGDNGDTPPGTPPGDTGDTPPGDNGDTPPGTQGAVLTLRPLPAAPWGHCPPPPPPGPQGGAQLRGTPPPALSGCSSHFVLVPATWPRENPETAARATGRAGGRSRGVPGTAEGNAPAVPGTAEGTVPGVPGMAEGTVPGVPGMAEGTVPGVPGMAEGTVPGVPGMAEGTVPGVPGMAEGNAPAVPGTAEGTAPGVPSTAEGTVPGVPGMAEGTAPGVPSTAEGTAPGVPGTAEGTVPGVPGTAEGTARGAAAEGDALARPGVDAAAGEEFLRAAVEVLLEDAVRGGTDVTRKVCEWKEPAELRALLDLELREQGEPGGRLLRRCRDLVRYSVKTGHPRFFNQLFSGLDHHALAGRLLTEALNTSQYTYEIAPVFVLMEDVVLAKLRELVGWSGGDGIFAPGGSMSNMYAMNVARFHRFPHGRRSGNWALPRLVLFASRESHYSVLKGAAFLGIGTDNVRLVGTDDRGKMIPEELEKEIERAKAEGAQPFFVCATCGTTVLGAFDPVGAIADVCQRHGLWLHVDAAWGGSALLSGKHRHLLAGIERADSVAWNPHKMLTVGLQCSAFLLRDGSGLLQRCHGAGATYLFQTDKFYDVAYDTGDKSPQCGRRVDCLKLWLLWKAAGTRGLARRVERAFACTRYLAEQVRRRDGFQLVSEPEFINLCFWFVPPSLRGQEGAPDYWPRLGKVAPAIKERMMKKGSMMVSYQPHGARVNFFRQIVTSPAVTTADLDFFLDEIERLGRDL